MGKKLLTILLCITAAVMFVGCNSGDEKVLIIKKPK